MFHDRPADRPPRRSILRSLDILAGHVRKRGSFTRQRYRWKQRNCSLVRGRCCHSMAKQTFLTFLTRVKRSDVSASVTRISAFHGRRSSPVRIDEYAVYRRADASSVWSPRLRDVGPNRRRSPAAPTLAANGIIRATEKRKEGTQAFVTIGALIGARRLPCAAYLSREMRHTYVRLHWDSPLVHRRFLMLCAINDAVSYASRKPPRVPHVPSSRARTRRNSTMRVDNFSSRAIRRESMTFPLEFLSRKSQRDDVSRSVH